MPEQELLFSPYRDAQTLREQKRKPLAKNHIIKIAMPLAQVPLLGVDDDETVKARAIKVPLPSLHDDDEIAKESLAAQLTHLMPVSPRLMAANTALTRDPNSARYIDEFLCTPEMLEFQETQETYETRAPVQQPAHPVDRQHVLPALAIQSRPVRSWRFSRLLLICMILVPLVIGGGMLEASQLSQRQQSLYQVNARTGAIQWQQTLPAEGQNVLVDAEGSLLNITTGQGLHQIVALKPNNSMAWKTALSPNTFSLFPDASQAETILIALSGTFPASKAVNGNTSTYLNALVFSLLDRQSGQAIWQKTLVSPQQGQQKQQQSAAIVGMDTRYIYVALVQSTASSTTQGTQLLTLNRSTGQVVWHITDHTHAHDNAPDGGQLLRQPDLIVWQVAGTLYAIDTTDTTGATPTGKVLWHESIAETSMQLLPQEEAQMTVAGKYLIIERSDAFHALDLHNGKTLWEVDNPGLGTSGLTPTLITSYNNIVLLYGDGAIEALDSNTQQIIWSQQQLDAIQNLHISDNGTLAYATTTTSVEGGSPAQAFVAFDMKNGSVRWTFQPSVQITFISLSGIFYNRSIVLTSFCSLNPPTLSSPRAPCAEQFLYALDATTGAEVWKYAGNSISDVQLSDDGTTVQFQRTSSAWLDLTEHFKNS